MFELLISINLIELSLYILRWVCIYPAYLNNKKSRQEGRKIRKDLCVENPTYQEIKDVLSVSNLRIGIENKLYPRERSKVKRKYCDVNLITIITTNTKKQSY